MAKEKKKNKKNKKKLSESNYIYGGGIKAFPHNLSVDIRRNKMIYVLLVLVLAFFIVFNYAPLFGLLMAFERFSPVRGVFGSKWVGLENFRKFFGGPYAGRIIRNTVCIGVLDLLVNFPAPIIFALILNEIHLTPFKKTIQTISYMPYFISAVVACSIVKDFVGGGGAISNLVAPFFKGESVNLLNQKKLFWVIYILQNMWQGIGYGSIIYLSALSGVDQELYEAAACDGAGKWKQMIHVTLPGIAPMVLMMFILRMGSVFSVGADKILLLYGPANYEYSDIINTYIYRMGLMQQDYGTSTAVGLFNSIIGTTMLITSNKIVKKLTGSGMF